MFRVKERFCFENVDRVVLEYLENISFIELSAKQDILLITSEGVSVIIRLSIPHSATAYKDPVRIRVQGVRVTWCIVRSDSNSRNFDRSLRFFLSFC